MFVQRRTRNCGVFPMLGIVVRPGFVAKRKKIFELKKKCSTFSRSLFFDNCFMSINSVSWFWKSSNKRCSIDWIRSSSVDKLKKTWRPVPINVGFWKKNKETWSFSFILRFEFVGPDVEDRFPTLLAPEFECRVELWKRIEDLFQRFQFRWNRRRSWNDLKTKREVDLVFHRTKTSTNPIRSSSATLWSIRSAVDPTNSTTWNFVIFSSVVKFLWFDGEDRTCSKTSTKKLKTICEMTNSHLETRQLMFSCQNRFVRLGNFRWNSVRTQRKINVEEKSRFSPVDRCFQRTDPRLHIF